MSGLRRAIPLGLLAALVLAVLGGGALLWMRAGGYGPWAFALSWQQMDGRVETQVLSATDVTLDIMPARKEFAGEATIQVLQPGSDRGEVFLLLNPGLNLDEVTCDGAAVRARRYRERIRVELPPDTTACELKVRYHGWPIATNDSTLVLEADEILLDKLQFWYPVDLKSFGAFSATIGVPEGFEVAWSGILKEDEVVAGKRRVRWEESRPVLAAGLAVGAYQRRSRIQGSIRCNVFASTVDEEDGEACLTALGEAYNFFSAQFGSDSFDQLNLVLTDRVGEATHMGGPLVLMPPRGLSEPDALLATLAGQVSKNWWGDTVSGRWFSSRPEASEWLVSGLAEYSAWRTLRSVKGRRAYLRYIETRSCSTRISVPMKTYNLGQRLRLGATDDSTMLRVRGAFAANAISAYAGEEAFDTACRNFFSVHRYTTVSFGALLHEVTLASEKPMDELVRVWFDRPGNFDYGITDVAVEPGLVHVTITNEGDMPAYVPVLVGVVTETGYHTQQVTLGVYNDTFSVPADGVLRRVVLDPEFELGDMRRANNVWPATEWPEALAVSSNGRIALVSQREWGDQGAALLNIFSRVDKVPAYGLAIDGEVTPWLQWDPEGQRLAVGGGKTATWSQGQWLPDTGETGFPVGWFNGELVQWDEALEEEKGSLSPDFQGDRCTAIDPMTGDLAMVNDRGNLVLHEAGGKRASLLVENVAPAGAIGWRPESRELLYFERGGDLVSISAEDQTRTVLLHRNYQVKRSRVSPQGHFVAWVDPAGLLRSVDTEKRDPVYISLPGEIVDFAWEGEEALVALVATIPRRLPMRYHADYTLWRIPVSTWQGVQLPYDPAAFVRDGG